MSKLITLALIIICFFELHASNKVNELAQASYEQKRFFHLEELMKQNPKWYQVEAMTLNYFSSLYKQRKLSKAYYVLLKASFENTFFDKVKSNLRSFEEEQKQEESLEPNWFYKIGSRVLSLYVHLISTMLAIALLIISYKRTHIWLKIKYLFFLFSFISTLFAVFWYGQKVQKININYAFPIGEKVQFYKNANFLDKVKESLSTGLVYKIMSESAYWVKVYTNSGVLYLPKQSIWQLNYMHK